MTAPATPELVRALPARAVAAATGASLRTAERWRTGVQPRRRAYVERLADLAIVVGVLGGSLTARGIAAWLTAPSAYLGGERPADLLVRDETERFRGAALAYAAGDAT
jgi:uncharacterized protein (DUF2384 family)